MNLHCFHCAKLVSISADQLGSEVACPSCGGTIRLPDAEDETLEQGQETGLLGAGWISNSVSGLVSLVLHMGLLLVFAAVTCDFRGGGGAESEEVLIGELPELQLNEQSDEMLESEPAEPSAATEETLVETLEIITPTEATDGDFSVELDMSEFSPSGGASGPAAQISTLSGGGGALGQGASFMGLHAKGTRFCIIADCSGSMEGPKLDFVKEEILETLTTMASRGRFQLIFFNSRAVPFPEAGWRHPRRDRATVATWMQGQSAAGGTDPTPAFRLAFQLSPPPDAIFFMTDGLFEERVVDDVANLNRHNGREVQIHTISFMDTSSEALMRRIANDSGGRYRHVAGF